MRAGACNADKADCSFPAMEKMEWEKASVDPHRRDSTGERASKWGKKLDPHVKLAFPVHL